MGRKKCCPSKKKKKKISARAGKVRQQENWVGKKGNQGTGETPRRELGPRGALAKLGKKKGFAQKDEGIRGC